MDEDMRIFFACDINLSYIGRHLCCLNTERFCIDHCSCLGTCIYTIDIVMHFALFSLRVHETKQSFFERLFLHFVCISVKLED